MIKLKFEPIFSVFSTAAQKFTGKLQTDGLRHEMLLERETLALIQDALELSRAFGVLPFRLSIGQRRRRRRTFCVEPNLHLFRLLQIQDIRIVGWSAHASRWNPSVCVRLHACPCLHPALLGRLLAPGLHHAVHLHWNVVSTPRVGRTLQLGRAVLREIRRESGLGRRGGSKCGAEFRWARSSMKVPCPILYVVLPAL